MKILVLNSRIYSIEFELIEMPQEKPLARGILEKIGMETSILKYEPSGKKEVRIVEPAIDHASAVEIIIRALTSPAHGVIQRKEDISAVGHRIVHGGEKNTESTVINENVKREIYRCIELAPLHNPYNLKGIEAAEKKLQKAVNIAVFDTSFYKNMPDYAYLYALPYNLYKEYGIRRYGFHGISHMYSMQLVSQILKTPEKKLKLISCHLGMGCSVTAIRNGVAVDTTMGFSPLDGLMMSTRSGSIDPAVVMHLMKIGWSMNDIQACLNRQSGILGVSGISDDMEKVVLKMKEGDKKAKLTVDMFAYQVQKYIGSYWIVLEGADAISFTGGIGVNSPVVRELILRRLETIGVKLDKNKNSKTIGKKGAIHAGNSKIKILCVPRNEHLLKAREVYRITAKRNKKK